MPYLVVLALSLLVGGSVYLSTVRSERESTSIGFGEEPVAGGAAPAPPPGYTYLRVSTRGPSLRDRIQGFVGVLVLVSLAAAAIAFGIYQAGHLINQTIESFLNSSSP